MSGWRTTQNQTAVIHIQNLARLPQEPHQAADRQHPGVLDAGPLLGWLHAGHLRPRHHRRTAQGGANDGEHPLPCGIDLSTIRSRWGQRLGQKKAAGENNNLCKQLMQTKRPETVRSRVFLARREGFEPPAFWSVGCLKGKSEPFRRRFALFTTVRSADLPLFPSSPARFFRILGQNWVKEDFVITKQKLSACENVYLRKRLIQLMLIEQQILSHSKTDNIAVSCNQMKHFRQLLHKIILFEFASRCSQSRVLPRGKNSSQ